MSIAVVILNWNGAELLKKFLPKVIQYSPGATIYVADNLSTDSSESVVADEFPEVKWIQNGENLGYAGGYQKALALVKEDIYVLLNSDIEVTENWLAPHLKAFKKNPNLAATQPKIKDYKKKTHFEYAGAAGGYLDKYAYAFCRGRIFEQIEEDIGQYDQAVTIDWASGACLFIRREDYWEAGGLDALFFAHQEEIDLCWRLRSIGKEIQCLPASVVYHIGGATLDKSNPQKTYFNFRNSLFMMYKNLPKNEIFKKIFIRLCLDGLAGVRLFFKGKFSHTWAIVHSHFSFYKHLSKLKQKRKSFTYYSSISSKPSIIKLYFINKRTKYTDVIKCF